jgi:hypothetical protein
MLSENSIWTIVLIAGLSSGDSYAPDDVARCFGSHAAFFNPNLRRIIIAGHQFVRPDWKRLRPTKAVNKNQ